jgi:hypothetical protein
MQERRSVSDVGGPQPGHASLVVFLVPQLNGEALLLLFSFARLAHGAFLAVERSVVRRGLARASGIGVTISS